MTGAELDTLTKVLSKAFGTHSGYISGYNGESGRSVNIREHDRKLQARFEVTTDVEFITKVAYEAETKAASEWNEVETRRKQATIADLVNQLFPIVVDDADFKALIDELYVQNILGWKEPESVTDMFIGDEWVVFQVTDSYSKSFLITVKLDGTVQREACSHD